MRKTERKRERKNKPTGKYGKREGYQLSDLCNQCCEGEQRGTGNLWSPFDISITLFTLVIHGEHLGPLKDESNDEAEILIF